MIRIFNDFTNQLEEFQPITSNEVKMYVCGPTVYDVPHLGHARSEVSFDLIRRYLEYKGFKVTYIHNYTDIDDKMINRANKEGVDIYTIADRYITAYEKMQESLHIKPPSIKPRASQEIEWIIKIIELLDSKGFTYLSEGSVWYDTSKLEGYKSLFMKSKTSEDGEENQFTQSDFAEKKRNIEDFVLWKAQKPNEPAWDSPWGKGRPGWHIECSAMAMHYLGESIDIHGGGKDLKRPHHQNEIAQSEAATGKPFVKYWLHNGFLNINSAKMSKSLGNFITLNEILEKFPGKVIRFFFLNSYYQRPMDFNSDRLEESQRSLDRLQKFCDLIYTYDKIDQSGINNPAFLNDINGFISQFFEAMDNDFNTAKAMGYLFALVNYIQRTVFNGSNSLPISNQTLIIQFLRNINSFLDILQLDPNKSENTIQSINQNKINKPIEDSQFIALIESLISYRTEMKKAKNYAIADRIRDILNNVGIYLIDEKDKTIWSKQKKN